MTDQDLDQTTRTTDLPDEGSALGPALPARWERHDRTHLEITLRYAVPSDGHQTDSAWEAYYFLPETFRMDATTYSKKKIFSDFRSYVRLSVPPIELSAVPEEATALGERLRAEQGRAGVDDLKLFASRVRRSIDDAAAQIHNAMPPADDWTDVSALVHSFVASGNAALAAVREVLSRWKLRGRSFERADSEVTKTAAWVDEHLSRVFELALVAVATRLESAGGSDELLDAPTGAALAEARYRRGRRAGPVSSVAGSVHDLERIERRQHALKRFTSSVLWLDVEIREGYTWAQHAFHALAAGIAMSFAVTVALIWGQPGVTNRLGLWAAVMVVAYMGKDRMKAMLQTVFDSVIANRLPDRRWIVRDPHSSGILAEVTERAGFVERGDLPEDVQAIRRNSYRDRLEELAGPESVLHHAKSASLSLEGMAMHAPDFLSLTDVTRVDVSRWLSHTDDSKRTVTLADPDTGELFRSKLPRAYDVTVIYRLTDAASPDTPWNVARIVVSRNGIRRIGLLDPTAQ